MLPPNRPIFVVCQWLKPLPAQRWGLAGAAPASSGGSLFGASGGEGGVAKTFPSFVHLVARYLRF